MKFQKKVAAAAVFAALAALSLGGHAQTIRIANQGDALSMDPHSLNEALQLSVTSNMYEPLVGRNKDLSVAPALATSLPSWENAIDQIRLEWLRTFSVRSKPGSSYTRIVVSSLPVSR